jgi:DNA-binding ferritin-like protein (Dps family)
MKKTLISSIALFSMFSFANAQDVAVTTSASVAVPPIVTTGDVTIDNQIRTLHKEMEAKIKALRDEYQVKIKAIIGDKKPVIVRPDGSTTTVKEVRKEVKEIRKEYQEDKKELRADMRAQISASGTPFNVPERAFNFFRNLFGPRE